HGPHHSAQKSRITRLFIDGSITSRWKRSIAARSASFTPSVATHLSSPMAPHMGFGGEGGKSTAWGLRGFHRNARRPLHPSRWPARLERAGPPVQRQSGRSSGVEHNLAKVGVEGSNPFARSSRLGTKSSPQILGPAKTPTAARFLQRGLGVRSRNDTVNRSLNAVLSP